MKFEIKHRVTGSVLFSLECESFKICIEAAVKSDAYLGGAYLMGADLGDAYLRGADLGGADLRDANLGDAYLRGADLGGADLRDANLGGAYLRGAYLRDANLRGADLRDANLGDAYLRGADLGGAYLMGAYLRDANLGVALKIDPGDIPVVPNIDAAILAAVEAGGTFNMDSWHGEEGHWCGTEHCRAGWAIHLAGEKGKALEDRFGPQIAGTLIYEASRPGKPAPWFYDSTEAAMEDIRKCAKEAADENR